MTHVRIVTDGSAQFVETDFAARNGISVLPLTIHFGANGRLRDVDLEPQQFATQLASEPVLPTLSSPTTKEFAELYTQLAATGESILSIHISGRLADAVHNARRAARALLGTVEIVVIDSLTTSVGLGLLVEQLAVAAAGGTDMADLVRIARGMIPRIYGVFYSESLDLLEHTGRVGPAQATLGKMLGIRPILALEEGEIMPIEKVRTRAQGIEKLVEFAGEFTVVEQLAVLHSHPRGANESRLLLDRLTNEFPGVPCATAPFGPMLAAQIGPHGLGIVILENEDDTLDS